MQSYFLQEAIKENSPIIIQNVFLTPTMETNRTAAELEMIEDEIWNTNRHRLPIVRSADASLYVPTKDYENGTVIFYRYEGENAKEFNISQLAELHQIESFYPGFTAVLKRNPSKIIIHTSILANQPENVAYFSIGDFSTESPRQHFSLKSPILPSVRLNDEFVYVPSFSPFNGTLIYSKRKLRDHLGDKARKEFIVSLDEIEVYYPGFRDITRSFPQPEKIMISNSFYTPGAESNHFLDITTPRYQPEDIGNLVPSWVTTSSTEVEEEQVLRPFSIKNRPSPTLTTETQSNFNEFVKQVTTMPSPITTSTTVYRTESGSVMGQVDELVHLLDSNLSTRPFITSDIQPVQTKQPIVNYVAQTSTKATTSQNFSLDFQSEPSLPYITDKDSLKPATVLKKPTYIERQPTQDAQFLDGLNTRKKSVLVTVPDEELSTIRASTPSITLESFLRSQHLKDDLVVIPSDADKLESKSSIDKKKEPPSFASLVLAHTKALLNGQPSHLFDEFLITLENSETDYESPASHRDVQIPESIVEQLDRKSSKSTSTPSPPSLSLEDQIFSIAQSLVGGQTRQPEIQSDLEEQIDLIVPSQDESQPKKSESVELNVEDQLFSIAQSLSDGKMSEAPLVSINSKNVKDAVWNFYGENQNENLGILPFGSGGNENTIQTSSSQPLQTTVQPSRNGEHANEQVGHKSSSLEKEIVQHETQPTLNYIPQLSNEKEHENDTSSFIASESTNISDILSIMMTHLVDSMNSTDWNETRSTELMSEFITPPAQFTNTTIYPIENPWNSNEIDITTSPSISELGGSSIELSTFTTLLTNFNDAGENGPISVENIAEINISRKNVSVELSPILFPTTMAIDEDLTTIFPSLTNNSLNYAGSFEEQSHNPSELLEVTEVPDAWTEMTIPFETTYNENSFETKETDSFVTPPTASFSTESTVASNSSKSELHHVNTSSSSAADSSNCM